MKTNGKPSTPNREHILREATYYACVYGNYDTSYAAQASSLLTITVLDATVAAQPRPKAATHRFFVVINRTAYFVTRYTNRYEVEPADQNEDQQQEEQLREAVLETALCHLTSAGYQRGQSRKADKEYFIAKLLEEGAADQQREESDPVRHPVVRDELPGLTIPGEGTDEGIAPLVLRQWCVEIGPRHACHVGLVGYDEDGNPELVARGQGHDNEEGET